MDKSDIGPWGWRPSKIWWYRKLGGLLSSWRPIVKLELDASVLRHRLSEALESRQNWLLHPCLSALTLEDSQGRLQRDFQLAAWTAAHSQKPLGWVVVPEPLWLWTSQGGSAISPGKYDLQDLGARLSQAQSPGTIDLDVFGRSIAIQYSDTWSAHEPLCERKQQQLKDEVLIFLRAIHVAGMLLDDFKEWAASVTRVIVPFYSKDDGAFRSSSQATIPGLIFSDLSCGEVQILEALAHESSHLHFFLAEAAGPLVEQADEARYQSPLRADLRPLRGIFLAYHALAYICAFYVDLLHKNVAINEDSKKELNTLRRKLDHAESTLTEHQHLLTKSGLEFFDLTKKVAQYGRR